MAAYCLKSKMAAAAMLDIAIALRFWVSSHELAVSYLCFKFHQNRSINDWVIAYLVNPRWRPPPSWKSSNLNFLAMGMIPAVRGINGSSCIKVCFSWTKLEQFSWISDFAGKSLTTPTFWGFWVICAPLNLDKIVLTPKRHFLGPNRFV